MRGYFTSLKKGGKVSFLEATEFTSYLAELLNSKISVGDALQLIAGGYENKASSKIATALLAELNQGHSFSRAIETYEHWFDSLYCQLVATGEVSGRLPELLHQIASYRNSSYQIRQKLWRAAAYPVTVLVVASFMMLGLLTLVVPRFTELFGEANTELPALTLMVIGISDWLLAYWLVLPIAVMAITLLVWLCYRRPTSRILLLKLISRLPFVGKLIVMRQREVVLRLLALMIEAKVSLAKSVKQLAATTSPLVKTQLDRMTVSLYQGQSLDVAMDQSGLFVQADCYVARLGQKSSKLDNLLLQQANRYAAMTERKLHLLVLLLEPLLMLGIGVVIALVVLAVYLPLFSIGSAL